MGQVTLVLLSKEGVKQVELVTFYATFGMGHGFREYYAEVRAESWIDAQEMMNDCFGSHWCTLYPESDLETCIQVYDKRKGFVIQREPNGMTLGIPFVQPEFEP